MSNSYAAIGDVHGRFDLLIPLVERLTAEHGFRIDRYVCTNRRLVLLGDYIDRGDQSAQVIDWLIRYQASMIVLPGNHEVLMAEALRASGRIDAWPQLANWVRNGGADTIRSYVRMGEGVASKALMEELIKAGPSTIAALIPKEHRQFIEHLAFERRPYYLDEDQGLLFVHAGIHPRKSLRAHRRAELLWSRDPAFLAEKDPKWKDGWRVVHGHSIENTPRILPHRIGIDTGAYVTNRLSCAVLEPGQPVVTIAS